MQFDQVLKNRKFMKTLRDTFGGPPNSDLVQALRTYIKYSWQIYNISRRNRVGQYALISTESSCMHKIVVANFRQVIGYYKLMAHNLTRLNFNTLLHDLQISHTSNRIRKIVLHMYA